VESFREQAKTLIERLLADDPSLLDRPVKEAVERVSRPPSTPVSLYKTMASADTEYEITLPTGTKRFSVKMRSTSYAWRYSYSPGKVAASENPYTSVPAGGEYYEEHLELAAGVKLYVSCSTAAQTLEGTAWR